VTRRQPLSPRQRAAWDALRRFQERHGRPPTRAELGAALGVRAQTADFHLKALARKGWVELEARSARAVRLPGGTAATDAAGVPVLGRVAAGGPRLALAEAEERAAPPPRCRADFALRVEGDSMVEAGILDGDLVFVRRDPEPPSGAVVVAQLGEGETSEVTVKRLRRRGRGVVLEPANPAYAPIRVPRGEPLRILGRVVGVSRTLEPTLRGGARRR